MTEGPSKRPPTRSGRPRGSYAKSTITRNAILDSALAVFAQGGYRSGSIREIAERVGISEAGLLHHFRSKSRLLEAVLEHRDELASQFVPPHPDDGREFMHGLIRLAQYNASTPGVVELYCALSAEATSPSHPAHRYFVRRYEITRRTITEAFDDLRRRGSLREGVAPGEAAMSTIAIMDGLQVQWLLDRASLDMATELRRHIVSLADVEL